MAGQTLLQELRLQRSKSGKTGPLKICLLRLSAIGDVCHAVSMVQALQRQLPDAELTWVIGKIEADLLQGLPGVEFVIFNKRAGWREYLELRRKIGDRQFDVLLHMQVAFRASLASACIPAGIKIGFDRSRAKEGQWLFTDRPIAQQKQAHVLEGFMGFAQALGLEDLKPRWQMPISELDHRWAQSKTESLGPFVVISPAASKAERNWTVEGYVELANYLDELQFNVVLCGGPSAMERELAKSIQNKTRASTVNLVGQTSLKELLAVLQRATLLVAPDTGPTHMAVTVGTPVVGLYAHSNPRRTGPYLYQDYVVNQYDIAIKQQHGIEWTGLPWGIRAKGEHLMRAISFDEVKASVDRIIQDFALAN